MRYAATIGFFDGVHRGHREVIRRLREVAEREGLLSMVVTFDNHPMTVVRPGYEPDLLLSFEEKMQKLAKTGVDRIVALHFTPEMMQQPARDFMQETLNEGLGVDLLMMGYDNRFGRRNPDETFDSYVSYGKEMGIKVIEGPRPEDCGLFEDRPISSSLIRELLASGRKDDAKTLL